MRRVKYELANFTHNWVVSYSELSDIQVSSKSRMFNIHCNSTAISCKIHCITLQSLNIQYSVFVSCLFWALKLFLLQPNYPKTLHHKGLVWTDVGLEPRSSWVEAISLLKIICKMNVNEGRSHLSASVIAMSRKLWYQMKAGGKEQ